MSDNLHNSKGFLKDKLGDYRVNPPESVWESISGRLSGRSRRMFWVVSLSAAATIALAVTIGVRLYDSAAPAGTAGSSEQAAAEGGVAGGNGATGEATAREVKPEGERPAESLKRDRERMAEGGDGAAAVTGPVEEMAALTSPADDAAEMAVPAEGASVQARVVPDRETRLSVSGDAILRNPLQPRVADLFSPAAAPILPEQETLPEQPLRVQTAPERTEPAWSYREGEEGRSAGRRESRWLLGAALSPLYSFRDAGAAAASDAELESGVISYAGGVQVGYRTTSRLAIESGIYFNRMGLSIGTPGISAAENRLDFSPIASGQTGSDVVALSNSVGNIVSKEGDIFINNYMLNARGEQKEFADYQTGEVLAGEGIRQHLDYLELPVQIRYTLVDRDFELQLVGGVSTNLLVNNNVTMDTPGGREEVGYLTNLREINYSGNAGVGVVYHFHDRLSLLLEPRFRYFINSVNDATLPVTRPYTFGLFTGMSYRF